MLTDRLRTDNPNNEEFSDKQQERCDAIDGCNSTKIHNNVNLL